MPDGLAKPKRRYGVPPPAPPSAWQKVGRGAMTALDAVSHYPLALLDKAGEWMNYVPEPVRALQEDIDPRDSAQDDGLVVDPVVNFEDKTGRRLVVPGRFNRAQTRGFQAGALEAVNPGNAAQLASMALTGGASAAVPAVVKYAPKIAPAAIKALQWATRGAGEVDRALDYAGIGLGAKQAVEGAWEGDPVKTAMGAGFAGLGTVGRVASRPRPDDFAMTPYRNERPVRPEDVTPLEAKDSALVDLFDAEPAVHPDIVAELAARRAAAPAKPKTRRGTPPPADTQPILQGEETMFATRPDPAPRTPLAPTRLQPVDPNAVPVADSGVPVADRAQRLRPNRVQDAGIIPAARPAPLDPAVQKILDDIDAESRVFDDPEDVVPTPDPVDALLTPEPTVFPRDILGDAAPRPDPRLRPVNDTVTPPVAVDPEGQRLLDEINALLSPDPIANNASGESAASMEALNRASSMQAQGQRFAVRRNGGEPTPLLGPDAVDYVAGRGEEFGVLHDDGTFDVRDRGEGAPTSPLPRGTKPKPPDPVAVEPDTFDLGDLGDTPKTDDELWQAAVADARSSMEGDGSVHPAVLLARRIREAGGITGQDATVLAKSRASYRPKAATSGEMARVKDHGEGFGRWQDESGVFAGEGRGRHQDVIATDLIRRYPEYAEKFQTGDGLTDYMEQLAINRDYRKPNQRPDRPVSLTEDDAIDLIADEASLADRANDIGGDTSFSFGDLETPLTPEVKPVDPDRRKILQSFARTGDSNRLPSEADLMDLIAGRKTPVVDTLPTGEAQPRLPGDVGDVRNADTPTPKLADAPEPDFSLAPPVAKAPDQPTLPQALPEGTPTMKPVDEVPPVDAPKGFEAVAQRIVNAENKFIETAMEQAGLTRPEAEKALAAFKAAKAIKIDPVGGQYSLTDGRFGERDVIRRAAGLADDAPTPVAPKATLPSNVRDYLVKRLGYSPEAVAAMTPDEAIARGKAQTPPAEGQGATPKPPVAPAPKAETIVQQPSPLSTRDVPIPGANLRQKVGSNRPITVDPAKAATAPEILASRAEPDTTTQTTREKGINPRSIDKATTAGQKFVETGDEAALDTWTAGVAKEAEEAGKSAVKAGYKDALDSGTRIHSNPLADPEAWKAAARIWNKSPMTRFLMGGTVGAYAGHEEDDPWQSLAGDFLKGGVIGAFGNKKAAQTAVEALGRLRRGEKFYGERGVRPVLPPPGQKWGGAVDALSSPQRAVPELRDVQAKYEVAEQSLRGFDADGKPLKDFKGLKQAELMTATKEALKDTRSATRKFGKQFSENAKKAYQSGNTELGASEKAKARYVAAVLARLENQPTLSAQAFGGGPRAQQADRVLADVQYGAALLWNFGLGRVLNKTQKWYALNYVPVSAIQKAKKVLNTDAGKAATDFLHVERVGLDSELTDPGFLASIGTTPKDRAKNLWQKTIEKTGGNALKASDEENRRVVYLAATEYAKSKGGVQAARGFDKSPEAVHRWAMDVVNATQGVVGPMGQSPYISRLGNAATVFTKFSGLTMELALDAANNPRPETLGMIGVLGSLMALQELAVPEDYQLDMWKMLGAKVPVGFTREGIPKPPAVNQLGNFWDALSNPTQSWPEKIARTVTPDSPERYFDELLGEGGFRTEGMGTHRHPNRYGSLDEHSGYDALARLFGMETETNSQRILDAQQQRNFAARTTEASAAKNRPARQAAKLDKLKRSTPGESARDDTRSKVPVAERANYDRRFPKAKRRYGVAP